MRAALLILAKDLRLRVRDRSVFLFAFVVPIGLTFLFSSMFPDVEGLSITAAVIDLDGGSVAASFSDQVLPAVTDSGILSLASFDDRSAVESALREGELDAAWVLPAGFSDAVISGQPAEVEAIAHGRVAARARRQLDMASYLATARTAEQAGNYHSIVAIVLGMLGGVFVPISANSGFLQLASGASPHGWFLRGIADQTASGRWVDVLPAAGAIVLFGVVAAVPAVWRLRRAATW